MVHTALTPVFVGLRAGLHLVFVALAFLVIGQALLVPTSNATAVIALATALVAIYVAGAFVIRASPRQPVLPQRVWLTVVTVGWIALLSLTSVAAYLVFPLFFVYLHLLGRRTGILVVGVATGVVITVLGERDGWSVGGAIGPLVGAAVAVMIGLGYQALSREAVQRERLMAELVATRDQLVAAEHQSGVLAERSRLAREIHDTVAQGLSSIQMLLHAAERADPDRPGIEHIRLARETAAANLADARRFIRELSPPHLSEVGLGGTLRRLASTQWAAQGIEVQVQVSDSVALPMHLQTALLRIAQGALSNVIQHAEATSATITLAVDVESVRFTISDDGKGFDPAKQTRVADGRRTDSFGLLATKERVDQLGGVLSVDSTPGAGTTIAVELLLRDSA